MVRLNRILGYLSLALGVIGIALPLLPTTPFIILAAWFFARSHPELAEKLYAHPRLGPPLQAWRRERAVSAPAKRLAVTTMGVSCFVTYWLSGSPIMALTAAAFMTPVAIFLLTRPSPSA